MRYLILIFCLPTLILSAQSLAPSAIFSDHMVIQRDQPIKIWGEAAPRSRVRVTLGTTSEQTKADKQGFWLIEFPAKSADGISYTLEIATKTESLQFVDILIGDVWLCSGQSNMEWPVKRANDAEATIAKANDTQLRHFYVPHTYAEDPSEQIPDSKWEVASPETVADFTAVGYYFAQAIRESVDVPIGLLHSSWGGSTIEAWMPAHLLGMKNSEVMLAELRAEATKRYEEALLHWQGIQPGISDMDPGMVDGVALWAAPEFDVSDWAEIEVPKHWENAGYPAFDGVGWYRTSFELTATEAAADLQLNLGPVDDTDTTFVNGKWVGATYKKYSEDRSYTVPAEVLQAGENILVVRVIDYVGGGGIYGSSEDMYLQTAERKIPLAGKWRIKLGAVYRAQGDYLAPNRTPTILYNQMLYPLRRIGLRGVLWYQGESNADDAAEAIAYRTQFPTMITHWRELFGLPDLPFLFVQLANYRDAEPQPGESDWALLRESQTATLDLPHTGQAVIIDIGEARDIHPRNKQDVGHRLALLARRIAYGQQVLAYSPTLRTQTVAGQKIILTFDHVGQQLEARDKYGLVRGFAIAGADKKFVWALAHVQNGNKVVVWSEAVPEPRYVRYGWADNPDDLNLYNSAGLPVTPFRTDE